MAEVTLEGAQILDWLSFHRQSARVLGFPDFYGQNMDAWIDCLTYLDEGDGMSSVVLEGDERLHITVMDSEVWAFVAPEVFRGFLKGVASVNQRYRERGQTPRVSLVLVSG